MNSSHHIFYDRRVKLDRADYIERIRNWRIDSPFSRGLMGTGKPYWFEFTILEEVMEFRDAMAILALDIQPNVSLSSTTSREISWSSTAVNRHYEEH